VIGITLEVTRFVRVSAEVKDMKTADFYQGTQGRHRASCNNRASRTLEVTDDHGLGEQLRPHQGPAANVPRGLLAVVDRPVVPSCHLLELSRPKRASAFCRCAGFAVQMDWGKAKLMKLSFRAQKILRRALKPDWSTRRADLFHHPGWGKTTPVPPRSTSGWLSGGTMT
jgi:hypothetical protein